MALLDPSRSRGGLPVAVIRGGTCQTRVTDAGIKGVADTRTPARADWTLPPGMFGRRPVAATLDGTEGEI